MKLIRDKVKKDVYMVTKLRGMMEREELKTDHPQQRESKQWDKETRDNFIVTVIQNEDFDSIKICEQLKENGVILWLIDGLQRCTTIQGYRDGEFSLGKNINPSVIEYQDVRRDENGKIIKDENGCTVYEIVSYDLRGKSYAQLPEKLKENFDNCPVEVVKHLDCSDEEVGRHIVRYNSGTKMNVAQKTITYMYNVAADVKKVSDHSFFSDCAGLSNTKGVADKLVNEAVMGINFFDAWNKNAKRVGKFLNENATKEMFITLEKYLDRLYNVVTPETGKLFSEKNACVFFMFYDKCVKENIPDEAFGEFLNQFDELKDIKIEVAHMRKPKGCEETNNLSFAEIDTCNSTKDKGIIEDKLHILDVLMKDHFHLENNLQKSPKIKVFDNADESISELSEENVLDFIKRDADPEATDKDVDFYKDTVDYCFDKNKIKITSPLYQKCREALVVLMAYAFQNNEDMAFEEWIKRYANQTNFSPSQRTNYTYLKRSFEQFVNAKATA